MNDEIKEILDYMKEESNYKHLSFNASKLLLDYITNLQNRIKELEEINKQHQELNGTLRNENERLKEIIEHNLQSFYINSEMHKQTKEKLNDYKSRCEKAIEYIGNPLHNYWQEESVYLLNILQDKEEV